MKSHCYFVEQIPQLLDLMPIELWLEVNDYLKKEPKEAFEQYVGKRLSTIGANGFNVNFGVIPRDAYSSFGKYGTFHDDCDPVAVFFFHDYRFVWRTLHEKIITIPPSGPNDLTLILYE